VESLASSEQQSLRGHGDSAEVTAAITKRLADHCEFYLAQPFFEISAQLFSPDSGRISINVVLLVHLPPGIENGAARRFFQQADEPLD